MDAVSSDEDDEKIKRVVNENDKLKSIYKLNRLRMETLEEEDYVDSDDDGTPAKIGADLD